MLLSDAADWLELPISKICPGVLTNSEVELSNDMLGRIIDIDSCGGMLLLDDTVVMKMREGPLYKLVEDKPY